MRAVLFRQFKRASDVSRHYHNCPQKFVREPASTAANLYYVTSENPLDAISTDICTEPDAARSAMASVIAENSATGTGNDIFSPETNFFHSPSR